MPNTPSKKSKRRKPGRVRKPRIPQKAQKSEYEKLLHVARDRFGSYFDSKVWEDEKYFNVVKQIMDGNLRRDYGQNLLENSFHGTIGELLPDVNYLLPCYLNISNVLLGGSFTSQLIGFAKKVTEETVNLGLSQSGRFSYDFGLDTPLTCNISGIEKLPADLRKWTSEQRGVYFGKEFEYVEHHPSKDPEKRYNYVVQEAQRGNKLYNIRRINPKPSKKQLKKIRLERESRNKINIDPSFSLDQ